jgi:hypothetical protein
VTPAAVGLSALSSAVNDNDTIKEHQRFIGNCCAIGALGEKDFPCEPA